ncbi:MAG: C_GCAxxG_C_C family protein [Anaerolineales bacterium]|nr:C_GCAxxG_C_C family protein [Anaerolineales bacterium]
MDTALTKLQSWLGELDDLGETFQERFLKGRIDDLEGMEALLEQAADARYELERVRQALLLEKRLAELTDEKISTMSKEAEEIMTGEHTRERYHCSEAFVKIVGSYLFNGFGDEAQRMTTGLAGGVGGTHEEMCGALVGGVMCIGAMFGRARPTENDVPAYKVSAQYRNAFIEQMGGAKCHELRELGYGSGGLAPCGVLVGRAIPVFFNAICSRSDLFEEE